MANRYQVFFEGKNGGRRVKPSKSWRCFEYGEQKPHTITIGTNQGGIRIYFDEDDDGDPFVYIHKCQWKMGDEEPLEGKSEVIYEGKIK